MNISMVIYKSRRGKLTLRFLSCLVAFTFMVNTIGYTAPSNVIANRPASLSNIKFSLGKIDTLFIPENYGNIVKRGDGDNGVFDKWIIHIQDAHCNYEAQRNIAKILEILVRDYKIDLVAVEGAAGELDISRFGKLEDNRAKVKATDILVERGIVTGPEYLRITKYNELPFGIYGIENGELYIKNFISFRHNWENIKESELFIKEITEIIRRLKEKIYSEQLLDFDKKAELYANTELSLTEWVKILDKEYGVRGEGNSALKIFNLVLRSIELEGEIDFKKVEKEREVLIRNLEKTLPREDLEELVKKSLEFRLGKVSQTEYYRYLEHYLYEPKANLYKNLQRYIHLVKLQAGIDSEELFSEIDLITKEIKEGFFRNNIERSLDNLSYRIKILNNLLHLQLNRKDLEYFQNYKSEFSTNNLFSFIKIQAPLNNIAIPQALNDEGFLKKADEYILPADRFYKEAILRDKALVENTIEKMDKENKNMAVMVTGGFHTEGITRLIKEKKGIGYIVISPKITTQQIDNPYLSIMLDKDINMDNINIQQDMLAPFNQVAVDGILRQLGLLNLPDETYGKLLALLEGFKGEDISSKAIQEKIKKGLSPVDIKNIEEARIKCPGLAGDVLDIILRIVEPGRAVYPIKDVIRLDSDKFRGTYPRMIEDLRNKTLSQEEKDRLDKFADLITELNKLRDDLARRYGDDQVCYQATRETSKILSAYGFEHTMVCNYIIREDGTIRLFNFITLNLGGVEFVLDIVSSYYVEDSTGTVLIPLELINRPQEELQDNGWWDYVYIYRLPTIAKTEVDKDGSIKFSIFTLEESPRLIITATGPFKNIEWAIPNGDKNEITYIMLLRSGGVRDIYDKAVYIKTVLYKDEIELRISNALVIEGVSLEIETGRIVNKINIKKTRLALDGNTGALTVTNNNTGKQAVIDVFDILNRTEPSSRAVMPWLRRLNKWVGVNILGMDSGYFNIGGKYDKGLGSILENIFIWAVWAGLSYLVFFYAFPLFEGFLLSGGLAQFIIIGISALSGVIAIPITAFLFSVLHFDIVRRGEEGKEAEGLSIPIPFLGYRIVLPSLKQILIRFGAGAYHILGPSVLLLFVFVAPLYFISGLSALTLITGALSTVGLFAYSVREHREWNKREGIYDLKLKLKDILYELIQPVIYFALTLLIIAITGAFGLSVLNYLQIDKYAGLFSILAQKAPFIKDLGVMGVLWIAGTIVTVSYFIISYIGGDRESKLDIEKRNIHRYSTLDELAARVIRIANIPNGMKVFKLRDIRTIIAWGLDSARCYPQDQAHEYRISMSKMIDVIVDLCKDGNEEEKEKGLGILGIISEDVLKRLNLYQEQWKRSILKELRKSGTKATIFDMGRRIIPIEAVYDTKIRTGIGATSSVLSDAYRAIAKLYENSYNNRETALKIIIKEALNPVLRNVRISGGPREDALSGIYNSIDQLYKDATPEERASAVKIIEKRVLKNVRRNKYFREDLPELTQLIEKIKLHKQPLPEGKSPQLRQPMDNIGKNVIFDITGDKVSITGPDGELLAEDYNPVKIRLDDKRKAKIKKIAKKLRAAEVFQEDFIDRLNAILEEEIVVFKGTDESQEAGAFGHLGENGVLYIDSILAGNNMNMAIIHEVLHAYLNSRFKTSKDLEKQIDQIDDKLIRKLIREKAKEAIRSVVKIKAEIKTAEAGLEKGTKAYNDRFRLEFMDIYPKVYDSTYRIYLAHYYARYYLQNTKRGGYRFSMNRQLTNVIKDLRDKAKIKIRNEIFAKYIKAGADKERKQCAGIIIRQFKQQYKQDKDVKLAAVNEMKTWLGLSDFIKDIRIDLTEEENIRKVFKSISGQRLTFEFLSDAGGLRNNLEVFARFVAILYQDGTNDEKQEATQIIANVIGVIVKNWQTRQVVIEGDLSHKPSRYEGKKEALYGIASVLILLYHNESDISKKLNAINLLNGIIEERYDSKKKKDYKHIIGFEFLHFYDNQYIAGLYYVIERLKSNKPGVVIGRGDDREKDPDKAVDHRPISDKEPEESGILCYPAASGDVTALKHVIKLFKDRVNIKRIILVDPQYRLWTSKACEDFCEEINAELGARIKVVEMNPVRMEEARFGDEKPFIYIMKVPGLGGILSVDPYIYAKAIVEQLQEGGYFIVVGNTAEPLQRFADEDLESWQARLKEIGLEFQGVETVKDDILGGQREYKIYKKVESKDLIEVQGVLLADRIQESAGFIKTAPLEIDKTRENERIFLLKYVDAIKAPSREELITQEDRIILLKDSTVEGSPEVRFRFSDIKLMLTDGYRYSLEYIGSAGVIIPLRITLLPKDTLEPVRPGEIAEFIGKDTEIISFDGKVLRLRVAGQEVSCPITEEIELDPEKIAEFADENLNVNQDMIESILKRKVYIFSGTPLTRANGAVAMVDSEGNIFIDTALWEEGWTQAGLMALVHEALHYYHQGRDYVILSDEQLDYLFDSTGKPINEFIKEKKIIKNEISRRGKDYYMPTHDYLRYVVQNKNKKLYEGSVNQALTYKIRRIILDGIFALDLNELKKMLERAGKTVYLNRFQDIIISKMEELDRSLGLMFDNVNKACHYQLLRDLDVDTVGNVCLGEVPATDKDDPLVILAQIFNAQISKNPDKRQEDVETLIGALKKAKDKMDEDKIPPLISFNFRWDPDIPLIEYLEGMGMAKVEKYTKEKKRIRGQFKDKLNTLVKLLNGIGIDLLEELAEKDKAFIKGLAKVIMGGVESGVETPAAIVGIIRTYLEQEEGEEGISGSGEGEGARIISFNMKKLAMELGVKVEELQKALGENSDELAKAIMKIITADGEITKEEIDLIVEEAEKVEQAFNIAKIEDKDKQLKVALFMGARALEKMAKEITRPQSVDDLLNELKARAKRVNVDEDVIEGIIDYLCKIDAFNENGQPTRFFKGFIELLEGTFNVKGKVKGKGLFDELIKYKYIQARVKKKFKVQEIEEVKVGDIEEIITRYVHYRDKDYKANIVKILAIYLLNPKDIMDKINTEQVADIERSINSLIKGKGLSEDSLKTDALGSMNKEPIDEDVLIAEDQETRNGHVTALVEARASGKTDLEIEEFYKEESKKLAETFSEIKNTTFAYDLLTTFGVKIDEDGNISVSNLGLMLINLIREVQETESSGNKNLFITENPLSDDKKGVFIEYFKEQGIKGIAKEQFITSEEYNKRDRGRAIIMTKEELGLERKKGDVVFNLKEGREDPVLLSNMARIAAKNTGIEGMKKGFEKLFRNYYKGTMSQEDINNFVKNITEDAFGVIIILLPPISPFVKEYYNALKESREVIYSAA